MAKICWANTEQFEESDIVVLGIPDESKSNSLRMGTAQAPQYIRDISNQRDSFVRDGQKTLGLPFEGITNKVFDHGDISRNQIPDIYSKIMSHSKLPIAIGGDHSITRDIIKSISKKVGKISLVYFDAHPDFVSTHTNYYGSVFFDVLPDIDVSKSIQVGIRTPEKEELENIKKYDLKVITPLDFIEKGVNQIKKEILDHIGENVYISFDMDCIDPGFAPGVSVPVPVGLQSTDAVYLLKAIVNRGIIGMDIMEVCPRYDITDRTSHLASRMIGEVISSFPK